MNRALNLVQFPGSANGDCCSDTLLIGAWMSWLSHQLRASVVQAVTRQRSTVMTDTAFPLSRTTARPARPNLDGGARFGTVLLFVLLYQRPSTLTRGASVLVADLIPWCREDGRHGTSGELADGRLGD